jgi:hypothetical protein
VLVDAAVWPWRGHLWAHLVSDVSYDELHVFAAALDVPRRAFQGDHYDIPASLRERAVELGAEPVRARELVARLRAAGLRRDGRAPAAGSAGPAAPSAAVPPAS